MLNSKNFLLLCIPFASLTCMEVATDDPYLTVLNQELYDAAHWGRADDVALLCQRGANKNALYLDSYTPLYVAAHNGHTKAVEILLSYPETLVNHITPATDSSLYTATQRGHTGVVELLLKRTDINTSLGYSSYTPLHVAIHNGNVEIMKLL